MGKCELCDVVWIGSPVRARDGDGGGGRRGNGLNAVRRKGEDFQEGVTVVVGE